MLEPGRMRPARILRHTEAGEGSLGTPGEEWTPEARQIWVQRTDVLDSEKAAAGAKVSTLRTRFVVRKSSRTLTVTVKDRVACDSRTFEIVGIKEGEKPTELEWTCEARVEA